MARRLPESGPNQEVKVKQKTLFTSLGPLLAAFRVPPLLGQQCVECHKKTTPNIVSDWQLSKHSQNDVSCTVCHGEDHKAAKNYAVARIPTPDTCAQCHEETVT